MVGAGANGEPVDPGTTITFLINGSNAGPADAVDPVVTGQLPAGLSYVNLPAAIGWNCSFDDATNQSFSCLRTSDLAPGGALLLSYTAIVDADAPRGASLDSTVTASSSTTDPTPATATNTIVITQPGASISLIHSVSYSGDQCITNAKPLDSLVADAESVPVTWCLKVTNTGMVALTDVTLNAPGIGVVDLDVLSAAGQTVLAPAESINVSFPGAIPNEGLISFAGVAGVPSDAAGNPIPGLDVQVDDDNATVLEASINIETTVVAGPNGDCADAGELETVALGSGVTWCYAVTNTGFTTLSVAEVTDTALGLTIPIAPAQQRLSIGTTVVVSADTIAAAAITADGAVEGQPLGFNDEALAVPPVADRDDARLEILPSTPTPTATSVPVATATSTPVPVATSTSTPVPVSTATSTPVPVATPTSTPVPVATPTSTPVPVATSTSTPVPVSTATSTPVPVSTATATPVPVSTSTSTPVPASTATSTPVPAATSTSTPVPVSTATSTPVPVATSTSTPVPVATSTSTPVPVSTATSTPVPVSTATSTPVPVSTATSTPVPVSTATSTPIPVSTATSTPVPVATATSTPEPGATATATATPEPAATTTPTPEPDPLSLDLTDPFVCGVGFLGSINGGTAPYQLAYTLQPVDGGATIDLGSFGVPSAGAFVNPGSFIAPLAGIDGDFLVSVSLSDGAAQLLAKPNLFTAQVRTVCNSGTSAPTEALPYPGPFSSSPVTGASSGSVPAPSSSGAATTSSSDAPAPASATNSAPPLATTGTNTPLLASLSMLFLTLGGVLLVAGRREERDAR